MYCVSQQYIHFKFLGSVIDERCSDDPAAAHYRLANTVPMVGLWPTTEPNHIFYWDYDQLKASWVVARFGWSHAVPMT